MHARLLFLAVTVAGLSACDGITATGADLSADEVDQISETLIASSFEATGDLAAADVAEIDAPVAADITATTEFTNTRTCAVGGEIVLEGTRVRVWDWETHSGTADLTATKTHVACERALRRTDVVVTLDGSPNVAVEAHHEWENHHRSGLQTMSLEGAVAWATSDDRSGTCEIDLEVTFDPETRTRTKVGTVCHRTFDETTTWEEG